MEKALLSQGDQLERDQSEGIIGCMIGLFFLLFTIDKVNFGCYN